MNFILSIFLCLAMAVCGVGSPAELPDTAVTWTLSNVAIEFNGEEHALDPQLRVTTSVSEDRAALHFELESGGQALLPVSAAIAKDAVLASFGSGERAYTLTEDEFMQIVEADDPDDADVLAMLDWLSEFYLQYGALIGSVRGDPEKAQALVEVTLTALADSCGGEIEDVEVEVDGATLPAKHRVFTLTAQSLIALMDSLRSCELPELADILNGLLDLGNSVGGTSYASFAEVLESEGGLEEDFAFPFDITYAETDELQYRAIEFDLSEVDGEMQFSEEVITRGEETTGTVDCHLGTQAAPAVALDVHADMTMTGPANAPTATQMEWDVRCVSEATAESSGMDIAESISMRSEVNDGLRSGSLGVTANAIQDDVAVPVTFAVEYAERAEDDGSVTNSVSLSVGQMHMEIARLSFDLNRSEAPAEDYFAGLDEVPLTAAMLADEEGESPEVQIFLSSILADGSQAYLDLFKLQQDPSVQELISYFADLMDTFADYDSADADADTGVIGGADGPTSVYVAGPDDGVES